MWLAWNEIKHNKKNYGLIGLTIVLMLFMVIFLSGLTNGLARAISAGIDNSNAEYFVISDDAENLIAASSLNEDEVSNIKNMTSSNASAINIKRSYITKESGTDKENIAYFAIDTDEFINPNVVEGTKLGDEEYTIVLNEVMKDKGINIGDKIIDNASGIELIVVGFAKDAYYSHVSVGYISFETFEKIETTINPYYETRYNAVAINGTDVDGIKLTGVEVVDREVIIENLPGYSAEKITINMIIWVLVIITGAILAVFFYIITIQKRKQYGVMKAIGMKNSEISSVIIQQISILSCIGTVCGVLLAYGLSLVLPASMPFYFNILDAAIIAVVFIIISILGSLLSVIKVNKVDPLITIGGAE